MAELTGEQRGDLYQLLDQIETSRSEVEDLIADRSDLQRITNEAHQLQEKVNQLVTRLEEVNV